MKVVRDIWLGRNVVNSDFLTGFYLTRCDQPASSKPCVWRTTMIKMFENPCGLKTLVPKCKRIRSFVIYFVSLEIGDLLARIKRSLSEHPSALNGTFSYGKATI